MRRRAAAAAWVACLVLCVAAATQAGPGFAALPRPEGYVSDLASVFDADQKRYLENYLRGLERDTSADAPATSPAASAVRSTASVASSGETPPPLPGAHPRPAPTIRASRSSSSSCRVSLASSR